jgi:hypothetical protein
MSDAAYRRQYYLDNKERITKQNAAYKKAHPEWWKEYKARWTRNKFAADRQKIRDTIKAAKDRPCKDCGEWYPHFVMDFDHVRGKKLFNIGAIQAKTYLLSKLKAEIAKCDVVCANCHRYRTHGKD